MKISDLVAALDSDRNASLAFLEDILLDPDDSLMEALARVIEEPALVARTNPFASILKGFGAPHFIDPLAKCIVKATPGEAPWLADYMYALEGVLNGMAEPWPADDLMVKKLGAWLFDTGGVEISWKSGLLLSWISNPKAQDYLLTGAKDTNLFHETRLACIRGVVNNFRQSTPQLLSELGNDPDQHVRNEVKKASDWLKQARSKNSE